MKEWYTLYTKPKAEYQVAAVLQRQGLEIYLPELKSARTPQGRKREPFFPCYLFLKIDFEIISLSVVQWTSGLRRVLTFGGQPIPVSNEIIDLIRGKLGELKTNGDRSAHTFKPGETVRIIDGPFRDMLALFEGPTRPSERVRVLLTILGHASRVQMDLTDLEMVSHKTEAPALKPRRTRGRGRRIKRTSQQRQ